MADDKNASYGQQVVGVDFNPSGNKKVQRLKELLAEAIDIVNDDDVRGDENLHAMLKTSAVNQALLAQMSLVKSATYALEKK